MRSAAAKLKLRPTLRRTSKVPHFLHLQAMELMEMKRVLVIPADAQARLKMLEANAGRKNNDEPSRGGQPMDLRHTPASPLPTSTHEASGLEGR